MQFLITSTVGIVFGDMDFMERRTATLRFDIGRYEDSHGSRRTSLRFTWGMGALPQR
jgi:hypothetical protein